MLEKVLRTFPQVKQIYISIKARAGGQPGDEYDRYKNEIKDSVIFDVLKMKLGLKAHRKLLRNKVKLVPLDLSKENLGISKKDHDDLLQNLNVIINCAGTVEFDTRLDLATTINVTGPLKLMQLAEQCQNFEAFCQISTTFAVCE